MLCYDVCYVCYVCYVMMYVMYVMYVIYVKKREKCYVCYVCYVSYVCYVCYVCYVMSVSVYMLTTSKWLNRIRNTCKTCKSYSVVEALAYLFFLPQKQIYGFK